MITMSLVFVLCQELDGLFDMVKAKVGEPSLFQYCGSNEFASSENGGGGRRLNSFAELMRYQTSVC
jgi:hypothetical protein